MGQLAKLEPENVFRYFEEICAIPHGSGNTAAITAYVVDFAKKNNVHVLLRGVRNFADFSYEFDLSLLNRVLSSDIDTFFIPTDPEYFVLRSSAIKELASFGGDVSKMVPPLVEKKLHDKFFTDDECNTTKK